MNIDIYTWKIIFDYCYLEDKYRLSACCRSFRKLLYEMEKIELNNRMNPISICCLRNIKNLHCSSYPIDDELIGKMISLTRLDCGLKSRITDEGIKKLTNLKSLECMLGNMTTFGINHLTQLVDLSCGRCNVDDTCLLCLPCLTKLDCGINSTITDVGLSYLKNLKALRCAQNTLITGNGLQYLTNLTYFNAGENIKFTYDTLINMPSLKTIILRKNSHVLTRDELKLLDKKYDLYIV